MGMLRISRSLLILLLGQASIITESATENRAALPRAPHKGGYMALRTVNRFGLSAKGAALG